MPHYCIFKGYNTLDYGLMMRTCPQKPIPKQRYQEHEIPGRDGKLYTFEQSFSTVQRDVTFISFKESWAEDARRIFSGSGWLTLDDHPDRKCKAVVCNQVNFSQVAPYTNEFPVQFECDPYDYEVDPVILKMAGSTFTINNDGPCTWYPTITATASGEASLYIGGVGVQIVGASGDIVIDCANQWVRQGEKLLITRGSFPCIPLGESAVTTIGRIANISVQLNRRWL